MVTASKKNWHSDDSEKLLGLHFFQWIYLFMGWIQVTSNIWRWCNTTVDLLKFTFTKKILSDVTLLKDLSKMSLLI